MTRNRTAGYVLAAIGIALCAQRSARALEPIPDKLVVLTFDDSVKSHFTIVRPILLKHKFKATFFITEGFDFKTNKNHYMTWQEIAHLHRDGFEIGNHTRDHMSVGKSNLGKLKEQIEAINARCEEFGLPRTTSFAYPGNGIDAGALPILKNLGIRFARRGGAPEFPYKEGKGFAYEPGLDHPLLIPSAGDARPGWTLVDFKRAVDQARFGRIAVVQFHGVPDLAHPWVHCPVERFQEFMQYLAENQFHVIALRDLSKYVDSRIVPTNPFGAIEDRKRALEQKTSLDNFRRPAGETDLRRWLENMAWYHRFTITEMQSATGLSAEEIQTTLKRFDIRPQTRPKRPANAPLLVLPYPGGRHPRIGFLDGAIRPQRETKLSVFAPWDETAYIVLDVPEAIRRNDERRRGLLYLAHTHADTMWSKRKIVLEPTEWRYEPGGGLTMTRQLPNGVSFGTQAIPAHGGLLMEMWLTNNSSEVLSALRVQNCAMLKGAPEFAALTNSNKAFEPPYAACKSTLGNRWAIWAWEPSERTWGNAQCPCLHSDPQFGDCAPGQTRRIVGWFSYYQGDNLRGELRRLDNLGWRQGIKADGKYGSKAAGESRQ